MWTSFEKTCLEKARQHLGTSKGKLKIQKESWWWNEEVKAAVGRKKSAFKKWSTSENEAEKEDLRKAYKESKRNAKQAIAEAKDEAQSKLYEELEHPQNALQIFKIAAQRREKSKSIRTPKYIEDKDGKLLTREKDICERWKEYYCELLNEENPRTIREHQAPTYGPIEEINESEVYIAIHLMRKGKAEKAFDRVPRDLIWEAIRAHNVPEEYVRIIQDMYHNTSKQIRCSSGSSSDFMVKVGVHQGSVLSPLLFILVINHLTKHEMEGLVKILLFADDIAMISDDKDKLQRVLEKWKDVLEGNGLRISRSKTEYLYLPFSNDPDDPDLETQITLDGQPLPKCNNFKYLGSVINENGTCNADVQSRIQIGWLKFRSMTGVLCDRKMPIKLKGKLYKSAIRPALLYGSECWTLYKSYSNQIHTTEMRMLRWIAGVTIMDKIRNKYIRGSLGVTAITEKVEEKQMRWYGHIKRRPEEHMVNQAISYPLEAPKQRGRPRSTWIKQQEKRLEQEDIDEADIQNRRTYHLRTRRADPNSAS
ncbi:hypothetical protein WDU94_000032 [Cyamophila willieti]